MSAVQNSLLVDIGNTALKYALVRHSSDDLNVRKLEGDIEWLQNIGPWQQMLVANVGNSARLEALTALCQTLKRPIKIIHTESEHFGIRCGYEQFEYLGVDRWLAVLAARAITEKAVAVIDVGTAATCDIVVENRHLGGWIMPGFKLMRESLTRNTAKVFADEHYPNHLAFGEKTSDCVNYGCLAALQGMVLKAEQDLQRLSPDYQIILGGGGQYVLNDLQGEHYLRFDNLVLLGLKRFV